MTKEIIDKFVLLVMEYIHNIHKSDIIQHMENNDVVLSGLKCIIHVFKITFQLTECIPSAVTLTQKSIACYLEYVEQMQKTQFVLNANIADAVTFVYSKTINTLHCTPETANAVGNHKYDYILNNLDYITTTILWANNPDINHTQHLQLASNYLQKSILLDAVFPALPVFKLLQMFQENVWMEYADYYELVGEFLRQLKKKQKSITKDGLRNNMIYLLAYLKDKTLEEIATAEGFKTKYDIVSHLLAV